jgi:LysR family hydrogen peroxide-inducible transcriptional activator
MPTITQLEYVVAVAKTRHFGQAAEICHVAQPSLSMQIQKLEDELDTTIFDRSKKPIGVTELGQVIILQAQKVLAEHKKLKEMALNSGHEPQGLFHLGVIPTLSPYLLPLFIGSFSSKYPKVQLKINEYQTSDIIKKIMDDEIDAGLLVSPLEDKRIIERPLFFEPFYAYVSQNHILSKRKFLREEDLSDDNLWLLEEGHCFRDQVLKVCSLKRQHAALENVEFAGGNLETLKNMVKTNSGYTLLPELAVESLAQEEKKTYIKKFKKPVPTREVSLVYSRNFFKQSTLEALEREIQDHLPTRLQNLKKRDIDVVGIF